MLVLARKTGEGIQIADNVTVKVLNVAGGGVCLGIEAPEDVPIHREERELENSEAVAGLQNRKREDAPVPGS